MAYECSCTIVAKVTKLVKRQPRKYNTGRREVRLFCVALRVRKTSRLESFEYVVRIYGGRVGLLFHIRDRIYRLEVGFGQLRVKVSR